MPEPDFKPGPMSRRYGMFGLTEDQLRAHGVDLLPDEAKAVLSGLLPEQIEYRQVECWSSQWPQTFLHIYFRNRWWKVNREDLYRQVRTGRYDWQMADVIASVIYGVRLDEAAVHFVVIDALTDG